MAATLDLTQFTTVWNESFDSGKGMFSRSWGPGIDTSVPGQLTIHTSADNVDSGAMVPPWGNPDAGYGYGLYSFTLETEGTIGVYALTWPATDVWPGPELDVLEIDSSGHGYTAVHWKGDDGSNQFNIMGWGDVDLTNTHTFSMLWEQGRLTGFLDGEERWTTTEHVPNDYAHGGENTAPGIGVQTWWNDGALGGNNSITLYEASYSTPNGGNTGGGGGGGGGGDGGTTTPITTTIGSGADSLVLKISQDAWQGNAEYTIAVDGKQVGTMTAGASHGAGDDSITVKGDFAAGAHTLTVTFTNDAYGGTSDTDRNLFVDGVTFNGTALADSTVTLASNGGASFAFSKAATGGGGGTTGDTVPTMLFGTPGTWGQKADVWEGHTTFGGQDYHTFGATTEWGGVMTAKTAPATWAATNATHLAFDNIEQMQLDLHAAGTKALDLMMVSAKFGAVSMGSGDDTVTWVAHSDASGPNNTMVMRTGAGNDTVHVTAAGISPLAQYDLVDNGSRYNPTYNGKGSTADIYTGAGTDTVTVEGSVRLVLHGGEGAVKATGSVASDTFYIGKGTADLTGGAGNDWYVLNPGNGHVTVQDFASGRDHLKFMGLHASDVTTKAATEGGVSGLLVTYDAGHDSVFLAHVTKVAASDFVFA